MSIEPGAIVLVSGVPGAGKTTIAALLAARLPRAVHIEADALQRMIVSGARWPDQEPIEEGFRQLRLRGRNSCLLADSFSAAGFVSIIDDIVIGSRLDEYVSDLRRSPVYLVMLLPALEVLRERNRTRSKSDVFHQSLQLDPVARTENAASGWHLDTSSLTANETVDRILRDLVTLGRIV